MTVVYIFGSHTIHVTRRRKGSKFSIDKIDREKFESETCRGKIFPTYINKSFRRGKALILIKKKDRIYGFAILNDFKDRSSNKKYVNIDLVCLKKNSGLRCKFMNIVLDIIKEEFFKKSRQYNGISLRSTFANIRYYMKYGFELDKDVYEKTNSFTKNGYRRLVFVSHDNSLKHKYRIQGITESGRKYKYDGEPTTRGFLMKIENKDIKRNPLAIKRLERCFNIRSTI